MPHRIFCPPPTNSSTAAVISQSLRRSASHIVIIHFIFLGRNCSIPHTTLLHTPTELTGPSTEHTPMGTLSQPAQQSRSPTHTYYCFTCCLVRCFGHLTQRDCAGGRGCIRVSTRACEFSLLIMRRVVVSLGRDPCGGCVSLGVGQFR